VESDKCFVLNAAEEKAGGEEKQITSIARMGKPQLYANLG
jgi:hypothetical protein